MSKTLTTNYQVVGTGTQTTIGANKGYLKLSAKYLDYNIANNTSRLRIKATVNFNSARTWDGGGRTLKINDNTTGNNSGNISISKGSSSSNAFPKGDYDLYEWTETVNHNSNGQKSVITSSTLAFSSWGITFSVTSDTLILPNIPRASGLTVSKGGKDIADTYMLINIDRKSASFTDTLSWTCSNLSETIQTKGTDTKIALFFDETAYNTTTVSGYVKKLSSHTMVELMSLIPNATNINMTFSNTTYNGNTSIGSTTATFKYEVYKTTFLNNLSYQVSDSLSQTLTGGTAKVIKGISNVLVTNTTTKQINDNSTASSYSFVASNMAGVTQSTNSYTFNSLLGTIIRSIVTDSRGYSTSLSQGAIELNSSQFIDYFVPTINEGGLIANRTEATSSTINWSVAGIFWNGNFGASNNTLHVYYRYKIDSGNYGNYTEVTATKSGNTYSYSGTITVASTSNATLEVKVIDSTNSEYVLTTNITKGQSLFDIGEDILKVNNNTAIDGSFAVGSSGSNEVLLLNGQEIKPYIPVIRTLGLNSNTNYTIGSTYGHTLVKLDVDITNLNATNKLSYSSTNGYITIGNGVNHVKINANVMARGIAGALIGEVQKNSSTILADYVTANSTGAWVTISLSTKTFSVSQGDIIKITVSSGTTGTLTVAGGAGQFTYLNVEIID